MLKAYIMAAIIAGAMGLLGGCGIRVPEIQENPANPVDGQLLVQAIVHSIDCEIKRAVLDVMGPKNAPVQRYPQIALMDNWGAQVLLTLTVDEKSGLNPMPVWLVPSLASSVLTVGAGLSATSEATRTEKFNFFYSIDAIRSLHYCRSAEPPAPSGSLFIKNNLRLDELLFDEAQLVGTLETGVPDSANSVLQQNVLSHDIRFEVVSSGSITPAWTLVRATINHSESGSFLSTSRDRTHELLITLGPIDPTQKNGGLVQEAEYSHLASQLSSAIQRAPPR